MKSIIILLLLYSFSFANEQEWSQWKVVHCGSGLLMKTKRVSYNEYAKKYKWLILYKNPTGQTIHFSYGAGRLVNKGNIKLQSRITLNPFSEKKYPSWFLIADKHSVWFPIGRLSIGKNSWEGPYRDCSGNLVSNKPPKDNFNNETSGSSSQNNTNSKEKKRIKWIQNCTGKKQMSIKAQGLEFNGNNSLPKKQVRSYWY